MVTDQFIRRIKFDFCFSVIKGNIRIPIQGRPEIGFWVVYVVQGIFGRIKLPGLLKSLYTRGNSTRNKTFIFSIQIGPAHFGEDRNNPISSPRSVNCHQRRILQNFNFIHIAQRNILDVFPGHFQPVNQQQRITISGPDANFIAGDNYTRRFGSKEIL